MPGPYTTYFTGRMARVFSVAVIGLLLAPMLTAQTDSGRVRGYVRNQQGGALSSAEVTLTNQGTGRVQKATAGVDGMFDFQAVAPGYYKIMAHASGYQNRSAQFNLDLSQTREVDFDLQTGGEEICPCANEFDPERSSTGLTVNVWQISHLPPNGPHFTHPALFPPPPPLPHYAH